MQNEQIIEKLREVIDPELGLNVYDLGLIYNIEEEDGNISIKMTLTTPGCPLHESITSGVRHALHTLEGARNIDVQLVWDPLWNPEMMTDEGKRYFNHGG